MENPAINSQPHMQTVTHQAGAYVMEREAIHSDVLSKKDFVIGTVIALVMATIFTLLSSGMSLIVTFVPGIVFSWLRYRHDSLTPTHARRHADPWPRPPKPNTPMYARCGRWPSTMANHLTRSPKTSCAGISSISPRRNTSPARPQP